MKRFCKKNAAWVVSVIIAGIFISAFAPPTPTYTISVSHIGHNCDFTSNGTGANDIFFAIGADGYPFWSDPTGGNPATDPAKKNHQYICNRGFENMDSAYFLKKSDPIKPAAVEIPNTPVGTATYTPHYTYMNTSEKVHLGMSWDAYSASDNFVYLIVYYKGVFNAGNLRIDYDPAKFQFLDDKIPGAWVTPKTGAPSGTLGYTFPQTDNLTRVFYLKFAVTPTTPIETSYLFSAVMQNSNNNSIDSTSLSGTIRGNPHDPNTKVCAQSQFASTPTQLNYSIYFQNDGDDFVTDVIVKDAINDQYLDVSTFSYVPVVSSFNCQPPKLPGATAFFRGAKVCLPGLRQTSPRVYSYNETIGHVTFSIFTKNNIATDVISNKASIEFLKKTNCCQQEGAYCNVKAQSMGIIYTNVCNVSHQ